MRKQIAISLALTSLMATMASAASLWDDYSRAGKWEASSFGQVMNFSGSPIWGGGVGIGYNAGDHWSINADFTIDSLAYHSRLGYLGGLSVDWNILKKRFTPFLTVGAGVGSFPYWGATEYSYTVYEGNLGAGLRWDVSDRVFVKAAYRGVLIAENVNSADAYGAISLVIGFKF